MTVWYINSVYFSLKLFFKNLYIVFSLLNIFNLYKNYWLFIIFERFWKIDEKLKEKKDRMLLLVNEYSI